MARFPLLPVEDEGRLNDAVLREEFIERVFAFARLAALLAVSWEPRDLVAFHARHKLQLLAHDPGRYRSAGRIVAAAGSTPREVTEAAYRDVFLAAVTTRASRGRHANALQHAFSRIGRELGAPAARRPGRQDRVLPARRGPAERPRRDPRPLRQRRTAALARRADVPGAVPRRAPAAAQRTALTGK